MKKIAGDIIILHMCTKNWYGSWDTEWDTEFFVILGHFLAFYPPNSQKNQNFKKMKKVPGHIIILHMCTKSDDHMIYCSWDMVRDGWTDG